MFREILALDSSTLQPLGQNQLRSSFTAFSSSSWKSLLFILVLLEAKNRDKSSQNAAKTSYWAILGHEVILTTSPSPGLAHNLCKVEIR